MKSVSTKHDAAIGDSSDERQSEFFTISRHFEFKKDAVLGSWGLKNIPFGIEYVKNVELTELTSTHVIINEIEK